MYEPKKPISLTKGLKYKEYHIFRGKEMDFYSSVSGILVVHISDYSGKLCLSARLCFLFMRKQRWYRTYLSRSLLMADSIVLSGNFLQ